MARSRRRRAPCCARWDSRMRTSRSRRSASLRPGPASRPATCTSTSWRREALAGADAAGGKGVLFNTITVSDGISMGSPGMRYSLVSREVIADSIETVVGAEGFDGFVAIGGCDKNMPGCADGDRAPQSPGGVRLRRHHQARRRSAATSSSVFEAVGGHAAGTRHRRGAARGRAHRDSGPGSCGGMYTANTMASAIEALGLSLPNSSAQEAVGEQRSATTAARAGAAVVELRAAPASRRATSSRRRRSRTRSP